MIELRSKYRSRRAHSNRHPNISVQDIDTISRRMFNYLFQILSRSAEGFPSCKGPKTGLPLTLTSIYKEIRFGAEHRLATAELLSSL